MITLSFTLLPRGSLLRARPMLGLRMREESYMVSVPGEGAGEKATGTQTEWGTSVLPTETHKVQGANWVPGECLPGRLAGRGVFLKPCGTGRARPASVTGPEVEGSSDFCLRASQDSCHARLNHRLLLQPVCCLLVEPLHWKDLWGSPRPGMPTQVMCVRHPQPTAMARQIAPKSHYSCLSS